ncbi:zinc finger protein 99-like [Daktulosphaira vitifoliae]|uniref:zinc finger protein 99-like n=1 Tax=Daktulosphaira vitifoliae TaxID=58002 RepID=UPI0021A99B1D|nr:zinc finger protein 99-like [Daktulosphaira vitifoliae]
MSYCINSNIMELGVMPSQFLNVIIGENQTTSNSTKKVHPDMIIKSVSKSMKRTLESETTIIPIYSNSKQAKLINVSSVHEEHDATNDFPIKLPATLLAECTVEISNMPNKSMRQLADEEFIATVHSPILQRKTDGLLKISEKELSDVHDMITRVEAVYSDDEDSSKFVDSRDETQQSDNTFPFSCEYCPNKFSNRGALWQHTVATHSIEKTCECNLCGRKFYRNCSLALHMKSHSDEYNCACTICGREFNRFTLLQRHAKLHSEVAHFKCSACNQSFEDLNTLQLHATEHKDKLACDQCKAVFSTKESLDVHTEAMHGDHQDDIIQVRVQGGENTYACRFCGKTYGAKAIVKKHELIHTGERLKCDECGIEFTQKSSLMRHTKRIHPSVN